LRSSSPGARRDIARRSQIGSTAHDRHRPVTTLQCCSRLPLLADRRRACSPMTTVRHQLTVAAMATATRSSLRHAPPPLYPAIDPICRYPAIDPICRSRSPRRSRLPRLSNPHSSSAPLRCATPARGFLPRGLSNACPRSAPHCQATGRHLITLNDCRPSRPGSGTRRCDPKASSMSGQPSSDHAADRTQVGENERGCHPRRGCRACAVACRGACHRPSMRWALGAEERATSRA
jgi:hypothetical protein